MQPLWLLALMRSADRVPTKSARSSIAWPITGFPDRRSRPFRINVVITLQFICAQTQTHCALARPLRRRRKCRRPIAAAPCQ